MNTSTHPRSKFKKSNPFNIGCAVLILRKLAHKFAKYSHPLKHCETIGCMTLVVKPSIISTFQQCCTEHASSSHGHLPLFTALQGRLEYTFQGSHHIHDHLAHQPWLLNIAKCIACWRFKTVPGTNAVQAKVEQNNSLMMLTTLQQM